MYWDPTQKHCLLTAEGTRNDAAGSISSRYVAAKPPHHLTIRAAALRPEQPEVWQHPDRQLPTDLFCIVLLGPSHTSDSPVVLHCSV